MKKFCTKIISTFLTTVFFTTSAMASTIITAPLDSRPISTNYLGNLAALSGDSLLVAGEKHLDYFSADGKVVRFVNSTAVRANLLNLVKTHNNTDTTFIINTSSALTGGLVGSRCAANYADIDNGLGDLFNIMHRYSNPSFYVHLVMPRNLPETRGNKIWPNDDTIRGLGYFYLQNNPTSPLADALNERYCNVTPSQALIEWGYVESKKNDLGMDGLSLWERDFLNYFNENYCSSPVYAEFTQKYQLPFQLTAKIFKTLVRWQKTGIVNEIIIGNDDSQLPASVSYLFNNAHESWIPLEEGSPIKYSFARTYLKGSTDSIFYYMDTTYGSKEKYLNLEGKSEKVNFLFGLDEIPQLIYARDLAKRQQKSTDFHVVSYNNSSAVDTYDVLNPIRLVRNDLNYLDAGQSKAENPTDLYLFDYAGNIEEKTQNAITQMTQSRNDGKDVALIELYDYNTINTGTNRLFKKLMENNPSGDAIAITQLSAFSAWNTNANAIGLGLAHAQVYSLAREANASSEDFLEAQIKMLGQHILEDGVYFGQVRNQLTREGYNPLKHTEKNNQRLFDALSANILMEKFKATDYAVNGEIYTVNDCTLSQWGFPWHRLFDCYIDVDATVSGEETIGNHS